MIAEKQAPTRKKMDRPIRSLEESAGSAKSTKKARTAKPLRVLNCRARYAAAPSCTACAISCIRSVPAGRFSTHHVNAMP